MDGRGGERGYLRMKRLCIRKSRSTLTSMQVVSHQASSVVLFDSSTSLVLALPLSSSPATPYTSARISQIKRGGGRSKKHKEEWILGITPIRIAGLVNITSFGDTWILLERYLTNIKLSFKTTYSYLSQTSNEEEGEEII